MSIQLFPYRIIELNYLDILRYAMNPLMTVLAHARPATLLALASVAVVMALCAPLRHCASSCPHPAHSLPTLRLPCRPCSLGQRTLSPPLFPCLETECVATAALQGPPTSVSGDSILSCSNAYKASKSIFCVGLLNLRRPCRPRDISCNGDVAT
jgi:hypothetical protein